MKQITGIIIGAGQRGIVFADYAKRFPGEIKIVGVAEPRDDRLKEMADAHNVPCENRFTNWEDVFKREKFADACFVATQDRMHVMPTLKALEKGYNVLCEKPITHDPAELIALEKKVEESGRVLAVAHSLRYSVFFSKIRELLSAGTIGSLVSVQHIESIGYWHMAHSFVRGNWRKKEETSPIILAKCCHDLDILTWLIDSKVSHVSSYGNLFHFKSENRPKDAPDRCLFGCPHRDECPYYAPRFYLEHERAQRDGFTKIVSIDTSEEAVLEALRTGPYGRCVYACDNDVPDHQVVNLLYDNGVSFSMTMCAFTDNCERVINLMGTHGQIRGNMDEDKIVVNEFATGHEYEIKLHSPVGTHSGSDVIMLKTFIEDINSNNRDPLTSIKKSVASHLLAIASEESRLNNGESIDFKKWSQAFYK